VADRKASDTLDLVAHGHRRKGGCNDIETLTPVGPPDAQRFLTNPSG
jgi:Ca-activated chloride channel family protein